MALSFPRTDFVTAGKFNAQPFRLVGRSDVARRQNGSAIVNNYGTAIWLAQWTTIPGKHWNTIDFEAVLNSLNDGVLSIYAYDLRRPYPKAYPTGSFTDGGKIKAVSTDSNFQLSLKNLTTGMVLDRGTMFCFDYQDVLGNTCRALHEMSETVTVDGLGETPLFEVRPQILPGAEADIVVTFKKPCGIFKLDAGSISPSVDVITTSLSFTGYQVFRNDY